MEFRVFFCVYSKIRIICLQFVTEQTPHRRWRGLYPRHFVSVQVITGFTIKRILIKRKKTLCYIIRNNKTASTMA